MGAPGAGHEAQDDEADQDAGEGQAVGPDGLEALGDEEERGAPDEAGAEKQQASRRCRGGRARTPATRGRQAGPGRRRSVRAWREGSRVPGRRRRWPGAARPPTRRRPSNRAGTWIPRDSAMASPKARRSAAEASATGRRQTPSTRRTPRPSSPAVAAQARKGMLGRGMKAFTSAVYCSNTSKLPSPTPTRRHRPKRLAMPERNAAPRARRANRGAARTSQGENPWWTVTPAVDQPETPN